MAPAVLLLIFKYVRYSAALAGASVNDISKLFDPAKSNKFLMLKQYFLTVDDSRPPHTLFIIAFLKSERQFIHKFWLLRNCGGVYVQSRYTANKSPLKSNEPNNELVL